MMMKLTQFSILPSLMTDNMNVMSNLLYELLDDREGDQLVSRFDNSCSGICP
jgi:hypothetical protein